MLAGVKFIRLLQHDSDPDSSEEAKETTRSFKHTERRKRDKSSSKDCWKKRRKTSYSYPSSSSDSSGSETESEGQERRLRKGKSSCSKSGGGSSEDSHASDSAGKKSKDLSDDDEEMTQRESNVLLRNEIGLEWMTSSGRRKDSLVEQAQSESNRQVEEDKLDEQVNRRNPRELNPYLKDNGSGYPDDASICDVGDQPLPSFVGDGGVSWRLKALKRAKEQAAREGRKLDEVVEERWSSLGQLAASVAARRAAPSHAHLHAIRDRKGNVEKPETVAFGELKGTSREGNTSNRDYLHEVSSQHTEMRKPRNDNLSWKRNKGRHISSDDSSLIAAAIRGMNKFVGDGSFMESMIHPKNLAVGDSSRSPHSSFETNDRSETELNASTIRNSMDTSTVSKQALSANQLAAKALQLRLKGKHQEAEKLLSGMGTMMEKQDTGTTMVRQERVITKRYVGRQVASEQKKKEDDGDFHLAQRTIQNKKYSMSGRADDEYDFDDKPSKSHRKREGVPVDKTNVSSRFLTQQERCQFCFENPSRPKHLVISIANFTYIMLPQCQPVVQGHCCILPMQHNSSTRTVDKNVWEELRNFKKCILRMFAEQDKGVVFLETVVDLGKQQRHCLIDCIPIPYELSKQAPMYFKKAIDEAEEEWGQHEMKKVIPTSGNLRNVIPENFSDFHVEFGLDRGFVHIIDNDSNFKSSFGLSVVRGMLRLPAEDVHCRRRHESMETQKKAVSNFARSWESFDWTKELG